MWRARHRHGAQAALLAVMLVLVAACGTRLPDEAFVSTGSAADAPASAAAGSDERQPSGVATPRGSTVAVASAGADAAPAPASGSPGFAAPEAGGAPQGPVEATAGPNQASDVGVTETTIRIGTIVAENGVLGNVFQPAATGLRAWTEHVNARGGIAGRSIELFTCDDREDRARALECARQLVERDQVFALIATNTRAMGGASEYLYEQAVPVLGIPINNAFYRYPNFFSIYGSSYVRDGTTVGHDGQLASYSTIYRWFRDNLGISRAAVFNYDIAESAQAGDFIQEGLELEGFEVHRYVVSFAAPSFDGPVADMQRNGTQIIFDGMDTGANVRLCDAMARRGFTVQAKVSTIVAMGADYGERFNEICRSVSFIPGDTRPYTDTGHPVVAQFREAMQRYQRGKVLHQWSLEAWAMGELLRDALVAMGPAPTRAGFQDHLMALRQADLGGLMTPSLQWVANDPPFDAATVPDCVGISRWDDAAGGWTSAAPFPFCIENARQFFTPVAEQGN